MKTKEGLEMRNRVVTYGVMILISIIMLLPFVLLVGSSLNSNLDITRNGYSFIPRDFSTDAYAYIWNERTQIFRAYGITVIVTLIGTTLGLMMTLLYGYAISKPDFPGKKFFAFYLFFTMLFNGGLVPTYIMYTRYLQIKNTLPALIIPSLLMNAFNVIIVRTYIQNNVPYALTEAAKIDGAGEWTIFARVVLPLAKPIIATVALFIGVAYWNDWANGLYYVTDNNLYSIQQLLNNMMKNIEYLSKNVNSNVSLGATGMTIPSETVRMAIAVIGILPILAVFPFVQNYFVKGIAVGAVKG